MKKQPSFFRLTYAVPVIILLFLSVVFKSCSKSTTPETPAKVTSVQLATDPVLGTFMTDNKGFTLYYFALDIDSSVSKCTGGCSVVWPIFYDSLLSASTLGTGLNASDFNVITTTSGAKQSTFKGWPLYYYAPKDATGANVREAAGLKGGEKIGNTWFVMKTSYAVLLADKKVVASGTTDTTTKEFLTDSAGHTLYYFAKDSLNPSTKPANCTGGCIATWPVFYTASTNFPSLLVASDFGTITRTDGVNGATRLQSTYRGRPLYYYTPDASVRGVTKGEGVGKSWYVMKPDVVKIN